MSLAASPTTTSFYADVGARLWAYTHEKKHVGYRMGARTTEGGCIDCSGWTAEAVLAVMGQVNKACDFELYNAGDALVLLNAAAAPQIQRVGEKAGFAKQEDIAEGRLQSGMLIGVCRLKGGEWASRRWNRISHIVLYIDKGNQGYVSQSASEAGVHLTPYHEWLHHERGLESALYATNPFTLIAANAPHDLRLAATGLSQDKAHAIQQACQLQGIRGVYRGEADFLACRGHVLVQVTRDCARYKCGEIVVVNPHTLELC